MQNKKLFSILTLTGLGGFLYASSLWNSIMDNTMSFFNLLLTIFKNNFYYYANYLTSLKFKVSFVKLKILIENNQEVISNLKINLYDVVVYIGIFFVLGTFLFLIKQISQCTKPEKEQSSFFDLFDFKYPTLSNSDIKKDRVNFNFLEDEYLRNNPDVTLFKDYDSLIGRIHQGQIPVAPEGDENDKYYYEKDVEDESFKIFISNSFKESCPFVVD